MSGVLLRHMGVLTASGSSSGAMVPVRIRIGFTQDAVRGETEVVKWAAFFGFCKIAGLRDLIA